MVDIQNIINEHLEKVNEEEDRQLVQQFEEAFNELEESRKSNLIRILIGQGAMEKTKDGKLKVTSKRKANKIVKNITGKK